MPYFSCARILWYFDDFWCILGGVNDDFSEWNYKAMQTSLQDTCDTILYYATCSVHIWTRCFKRTYQHSCLVWRLPVLLQFVVTWPAFIIVNFKAWLMNSEIPSVTARAVARMNCGSCLWQLKSWPHVTAGSSFTVEVIEMCCEFQSVNVSDTKYLCSTNKRSVPYSMKWISACLVTNRVDASSNTTFTYFYIVNTRNIFACSKTWNILKPWLCSAIWN